jgi:P27 family predicted phage terminase small subunit
MRGPKPTPTALRVLRGNPSRRPFNGDEPTPADLDAAIPDEIVDKVARAEWTRAIVPAIAIGHITAADRTLAIAHCELWATWQSQLRDAAKSPHVGAAGRSKYPMPNQARIMSNKTLTLLAAIDEKLGFSPTSRSRVVAKGPGSTRAAIDKQRAKFFEAGRG